MNILSKRQLSSSSSLGLTVFWIYFHKPSLSYLNDEAVCWTALATPCLLIIMWCGTTRTPPSCPTPQAPSSLAWNKLQDYSRGTMHPLSSGRIKAPPWLTGLWTVILFLWYLGRALMVGPSTDTSEWSYTTSLSYYTDTILPGLG